MGSVYVPLAHKLSDKPTDLANVRFSLPGLSSHPRRLGVLLHARLLPDQPDGGGRGRLLVCGLCQVWLAAAGRLHARHGAGVLFLCKVDGSATYSAATPSRCSAALATVAGAGFFLGYRGGLPWRAVLLASAFLRTSCSAASVWSTVRAFALCGPRLRRASKRTRPRQSRDT